MMDPSTQILWALLADAGPTTYATWNPSDKTAGITLSNGNLTAAGPNSGSQYDHVRANVGKSSGKYYFEITVDDDSYMCGIGVCSATTSFSTGDWLARQSDGWEYTSDGYFGNNVGSWKSAPPSYTTGDIISLAIDLDNGKIWWGKNGTWLDSGDPANGTNAAYTNLSGTIYPHVTLRTSSDNSPQVTANFGASAFSYSVPTGFTSGWTE
jgi:hypothetical protein